MSAGVCAPKGGTLAHIWYHMWLRPPAVQLRAQHGSARILECVVCKVHVFEFAYRADGVCFVSEVKSEGFGGLRARARGFGL